MPAIQVARTDTFEAQRQKINQIGQQIFNISAGGSDLSTGNLKLGDGTTSTPSLSFVNEDTLGLFRSSNGVIEYVSNGKRLLDISSENTIFFKDLVFQKNILNTQGTYIISGGQNYEGGSYLNTPLSGGTGSGATAIISVENFGGSITQNGIGYKEGSFNGVKLIGGSGGGTTVSFSIDGISGGLVTPGSGYVDGVYSDINITGGSGSGAIGEIVVIGGQVATLTFSSVGSGYVNGDILSASALDLGGQGSGFSYEITTFPGVIDDITFLTKESGYLVGEILRLPVAVTGISVVLPGEVTGVSATLDSASTQITVSSSAGIVQGMGITQDPTDIGIIDPTATVVSIDSPTTLTISSPPLVSGSATLTFRSQNPNQVTVPNSSIFNQGDILTVTSGSGQLAPNTVVSNIIDSTTIFISATPTAAGPATLTATPSFGVGTQELEFTISAIGTVGEIIISDGGNGYSVGDQLTVDPTFLLQDISYNINSETTEKITFSPPVSTGVFQVGQSVQKSNAVGITAEIYEVVASGGTIDYIIIGSLGVTQNDVIEVSTNASLNGTVDLSEQKNKFFIDLNDGNGYQYRPNLTLYSGNTYVFQYPSQHPFSFSRSRDGKWDPENISSLSATVDNTTKTVTVSSTVGIVEGMLVSQVGTGSGQIDTNVSVESIVDSTTIIISKLPLTSGTLNLAFTGSEYTDGITRDSSANRLEFKVSDSTPSTLYYYCSIHSDMAGEDNLESVVTISTNNTRLIGSGFIAGVSQISSEDTVSIVNDTGEIDCVDITSDSATIGSISSSSISSNSITTSSISTTTISSSGLTIQSNNTTFNGNLAVGSNVSINQITGDITTSGTLRSNDRLNINNIGFIDDNEFYVTSGNLILRPPTSNIVKISSSTALVIPSGSSANRPTTLAENGSIRFNTTTGQYEGYNASTTSWSSLGGVRDIDGNTYIIAELTAGANDNTLWFFNDNSNTLKLTSQFLDFRQVKKISSGRLGIPSFSEWSANTPVALGQYLKYRNNLYEVTISGTTATSGNEPTHTSGATSNGTAELTWYSSTVSPLEFTEVEELRVGPNKDCPLIVSAELKFFNKTISTLTEDLIIQPALGKKVVVDSTTHFTIPAGNDNQKSTATAQAGSIRYNTTISQFEGYSGSNWSSLGGVRDVDGNTYIIPETAPGSNENILYFYNDNLNTLQLSKTTLDFTNIDTITTTGLGTLALDTPLVTLNLDDTTIDNRDVTRTFISTSKQYLDLGLSSGLVVDPVIRLDDQGDVYLNTGFGTGTYNGVKIFDGALKEFELADYAVKTAVFTLEKGVANTASNNLYSISSAKGCQVSVMCKSSAGKKSLATYNVIDNGSDIFHNEFGSLNTSADGFSASFDITPEGETRITLTLSNDHSNGDIVELTVVTQVYK